MVEIECYGLDYKPMADDPKRSAYNWLFLDAN